MRGADESGVQIEVVRHDDRADDGDGGGELSTGEFGDEQPFSDLGWVGSGDCGEGSEGGALLLREGERRGEKTRERVRE